MSEYAVELEAALERLLILPDYDCGNGPEPCVHTLRQSLAGPLFGAHWSLESLRAAIERYGVSEAGDIAVGMGHGLVIVDDQGPVFLATRPEGEGS